MALVAPLVDRPAQGQGHNIDEDVQIAMLQTNFQLLRNSAAEWLKENGDSDTADKLQKILEKNGLPKEVKKDIRRVLADLSFKNLDFGKSAERRISRLSALASTVRLRS